MLIYLNKTANLKTNGDVLVLLSFNNDTEKKKLDNWVFPNFTIYNTISSNKNEYQPEIIELCPKIVNDKCGNTSCVITIGVLGLTLNTTSHFRMIYFTAKNKLFDKNVFNDTIVNQGSYNYYWFTGNQSVFNPKSYWSYTVAIAV